MSDTRTHAISPAHTTFFRLLEAFHRSNLLNASISVLLIYISTEYCTQLTSSAFLVLPLQFLRVNMRLRIVKVISNKQTLLCMTYAECVIVTFTQSVIRTFDSLDTFGSRFFLKDGMILEQVTIAKPYNQVEEEEEEEEKHFYS